MQMGAAYMWLVVGALISLAVLVIFQRARLRYYCKFIYFIVVSLWLATLPIPLMLRRPRDPRNALIPAWGLRAMSRRLGLKFSVRGHQNIVKDSGCVVLINHQSALDLIVLAELWPIMDQCTVISKKEVFYLGPFGLACWLWGTIFIDRLNPEKAQTALNETGAIIRARKARVLMFPEGTRHIGPELLPFKKGAFHVAIASQCPIQPVVVSPYYFLDSGEFRFDPGHVVVSILPAVSLEGKTRDDIPKLMEQTRETMAEAYSHLAAEVAQTKPKNNNKYKQN